MNQTTHKMTDPIQIKHYKEDITSFNQLYKEFQRRFVRFANTYVRDLTTAEDITIEAMMYYWEMEPPPGAGDSDAVSSANS